VISGIEAAPLDSIDSVSLVLMSPSTEIALNDRSTACERTFLSNTGDIGASVKSEDKSVAILN
jgi:hypothetical protein